MKVIILKFVTEITRTLVVEFLPIHEYDNYVIIIQHAFHFTERPIEDHENIWAIFEQWEMGQNNKFLLRENFKKYDFFQNPMVRFYPHPLFGIFDIR